MGKTSIFCLLISLMAFGVESREVTFQEWEALKKAKTFYEEEKMQDIVALLEPLVENAQPHEAVFSYLSTAFIVQGKYNEAYMLLERATRAYPENYVLQYNFGITAVQMERYQEAISALIMARKIQEKKGEDSAQTITYTAMVHYMFEQYDQAIELIVPVLQKERQVNHQRMQLAVNCHIMKENWTQAEGILSKWIEREPENSHPWQMLGDALLRQEKYREAVCAHEIAILLGNKNISPDNLFAVYRYLYIHSEAARWAEHLGLGRTVWLDHATELYLAANFTEALQILDNEPTVLELPEAIILYGKILLALGKNDEAVAAWLSCKNLPLPDSRDPGKARRERDKMTAEALLLAGETCWRQRKWLEARDIFRELSYLPGYENNGHSLVNTMQYLLDNIP